MLIDIVFHYQFYSVKARKKGCSQQPLHPIDEPASDSLTKTYIIFSEHLTDFIEKLFHNDTSLSFMEDSYFRF